MVVLHVKQENSLFLLKTTLNSMVFDTLKDVLFIYNGQSHVNQICSKMKRLVEYGSHAPMSIIEDINLALEKLKMSESSTEENCKDVSHHNSTGNSSSSDQDVFLKPNDRVQKIICRIITEVKARVSDENVTSNKCISKDDISEALIMLKGAQDILFEKQLSEFEKLDFHEQNNTDSILKQEEIAIETASLWFSNKRLMPDKKLSEYFGSNEKSKVIVKLSANTNSPPKNSSTDNERMTKRIDDFDKLFKVETVYSYSEDSVQAKDELKRKMHGMQKITWK